MRKNTLIVVLASGAAIVAVSTAIGAPPPNRPAESKAVAATGPVTTVPLPDILMKIESDGTIVIRNVGDVSVPKPFLVDVSCSVKPPSQPQQKCGAPFDAGGRWLPTLTLPPGTNQFPLKESPGQATFIRYGPGWAMLYPGVLSWPKGTYTLSGCANPNPPDPARVVREKTHNNNCSFADVTRN